MEFRDNKLKENFDLVKKIIKQNKSIINSEQLNNIERIMNFINGDYIKVEDISNFIIKEAMTNKNKKEDDSNNDVEAGHNEIIKINLFNICSVFCSNEFIWVKSSHAIFVLALIFLIL